MNVKKGEPPKSVERSISIDFSRDEIISVLTAYVKSKVQSHPVKIENLEVHCGDEGKLSKVELSGVEIIPINWDKTQQKAEERDE